jgi:NodT family efflux transporter outer membrane factor (OMF) lipoprotein
MTGTRLQARSRLKPLLQAGPLGPASFVLRGDHVRSRWSRALLWSTRLSLVTALVSGCAVGPDFRRPELAKEAGVSDLPLPVETASSPGKDGAAQRLVSGRDIPAQWWTLFRCEPLDRLINLAFRNSPTLAAAQATLRQAEENRRAQLALLFPRLNGNLSATRNKISGASFGAPRDNPGPFTLYNASVDVSYTLDVFGVARRGVEALQAQVEYQRFQIEAAYLSLSANIVTAAVREASLRAQVRATREIVALQQQQIALMEVRYRNGAVSELEVTAQRAQLAQTLGTLPPLEKELGQTRHLLALLVGKFPNEAAALPEFELDALHLPEELPVSLPSALARQRPDILAAEELLHVASAEVGVATANLYPQINLTGSLGSEALSIGSVFGTGSAVWSLGAGLVQPLFRGGELTAKRRAAVAAFDQAAAQYRETVLQAFQDVADVLQALDQDAKTLKAQTEGALAARRSLELTEEQLRFGAVSYLSLLDADRQYQLARLNQIQAQAARYADTAALFHALGGGWWNR